MMQAVQTSTCGTSSSDPCCTMRCLSGIAHPKQPQHFLEINVIPLAASIPNHSRPHLHSSAVISCYTQPTGQWCSSGLLSELSGDSGLEAMESSDLPLWSPGILDPHGFLWENVLCCANREMKIPMHALLVSASPAQCLSFLLRTRLVSGHQLYWDLQLGRGAAPKLVQMALV